MIFHFECSVKRLSKHYLPRCVLGRVLRQLSMCDFDHRFQISISPSSIRSVRCSIIVTYDAVAVSRVTNLLCCRILSSYCRLHRIASHGVPVAQTIVVWSNAVFRELMLVRFVVIIVIPSICFSKPLCICLKYVLLCLSHLLSGSEDTDAFQVSSRGRETLFAQAAVLVSEGLCKNCRLQSFCLHLERLVLWAVEVRLRWCRRARLGEARIPCM